MRNAALGFIGVVIGLMNAMVIIVPAVLMLSRGELSDGVSGTLDAVWVAVCVLWGLSFLLLARMLSKLGCTSWGLFLLGCLLGVPVYGILYYFGRLVPVLGVGGVAQVGENILCSATVPEPSAAWGRHLMDIWFASLPILMGVLFAWFAVKVARAEVSLWTLAAGFLLILTLLSPLWCLLKIDESERGAKKAGWFALVLILQPVGCMLWYFLAFRKSPHYRKPVSAESKGSRGMPVRPENSVGR